MILNVALVVIAFDQLTKRLVIQWLGPDSGPHRWELAGKYLAFEYVENRGAAFGFFAGRAWLLTALALIVGFIFVFLLRHQVQHDQLARGTVGLVIGGASGNLLDRIRMGHVTDFIAVGTWPKFNVADSAISIGLILMVTALTWDDHPESGEPD